ncbi:MAG: hypothetical protein APF84_04705 [Gracilibacter sp. BRH_c7a]|nr:MAG: hypothetical protein APF84_04705 [Gracilibacter sp. BRH_c7a]
MMLFRKMRRDLLEQKGAYAACIVVIAIGLMMYSSMSIVMDNLTLSRDTFYENQHFADGFAEIQAMPYNQIENLKKIEGIQDVQGRLIKDVRVVMPDSKENVYLRLVSIDTSQSKVLNDVLLDEGIPLSDDNFNMWVDNKFFVANSLQLNDEIDFIAEGKMKTFRVIGSGKSPEFIYTLRTVSEIYPNPETFGIGYLPLSVMKNLFQEKEAVNDIVFTLKPDANFDEVKAFLEVELKPYGLESIYPRKDQLSTVMLNQELASLQAMAKSMPLIFLSVAAMILYIMLKRMIEQQRTQLGTLKAFGYTKNEILFHYVSYALITGLLGGMIGGISGSLLTGPFLSLYRDYFNMPGMEASFSPQYFFLSLVLATSFALVAGYQGCRKMLILEPAEAIRPAAPPPGKNVIFEKAIFFWKMLTVQGKMALRNLARNKVRTSFLFIGIMFTFSLLALPWSFKALSDVLLFEQFEKIETYDVKIPLALPLSQEKVQRELADFDGVKAVESMAEIPVTLNNSWHEKSVVLLGLKSNSSLYHIVDSSGKSVRAPENGILISQRLADLLQADVGTTLSVGSPYFSKPDERKYLQVVGVISQNLGLNAYMEISALQAFLGQGPVATSLIISIEETSIPLLMEKYNDSPVINSIENRLSLLSQMRDLMASYSGTIYIMFIFGIIIGFAIIYNSSVITVSERSRELASMMVLGMNPEEVLEVVTFEQWFISIFGMLAGIPLTKLMMIGMAQSVASDMFSFNPEITVDTLIVAFLITVASMIVAQRMAARKLKKLSLVEVLKSRE